MCVQTHGDSTGKRSKDSHLRERFLFVLGGLGGLLLRLLLRRRLASILLGFDMQGALGGGAEVSGKDGGAWYSCGGRAWEGGDGWEGQAPAGVRALEKRHETRVVCVVGVCFVGFEDSFWLARPPPDPHTRAPPRKCSALSTFSRLSIMHLLLCHLGRFASGLSLLLLFVVALWHVCAHTYSTHA